MSTNDKKIIWKKASQKTTDVSRQSISSDQNSTQATLAQDILSHDEMLDLAKRSGSYRENLPQQDKKESTTETITDLQSEIDALFGKKTPSKSQDQNSQQPKEVPLVKEATTSVVNNKVLDEKSELENLKSDINSLFSENSLPGGTDNSGLGAKMNPSSVTSNKVLPKNKPLNDGFSQKVEKSESVAGSAALSAAMGAIEKKKGLVTDSSIPEAKKEMVSKEEVKKDSSEDIVASIKDSINEDLRHPLLKDKVSAEKLDEVQTAKLLEEKKKAKGVGQTYYSDLSTAMGSNNPATMSELIKRARREKKIKSIKSPTSKKNLIYIIGTIFLLLGIMALSFFLFKKEKPVEFITEKRVSSLVYANTDTGINTAGIESARTKQAIRKVLEEDLADDNIRQIYYVGQDQLGNLRRSGIKQTFEATDNLPPDLLYENIENDFMHGVYRTDKNEPFLILKALSYDRAYDGLKEWEPTMIDDLSAYFDLPKEAGDRSLLEPGFSDDLIKNKNVRVARFLPREVDRRNGVFDLFKPTKNESQDPAGAGTVETVNTNAAIGGASTEEAAPATGESGVVEKVALITKSFLRNVILNSGKQAFAQITFQGQNQGSTTSIGVNSPNENLQAGENEEIICYKKVTYCINNANGAKTKDVTNTQKTNANQTCYSESDTAAGEFGEDKKSDANYSCIKRRKQGGGINDSEFFNKYACFDAQTGAKLATETPSSGSICFPAYQCWEYQCREGDKVYRTAKENNEKQGQPGVRCGKISTPIPYQNIKDYPYQKVCASYPELLNIQNINSKNICFDKNKRYVEGLAVGPDGSLPEGVNCILPLNRDASVCIERGTDRVVLKKEGVPESAYKLCFKPLDGTTKLIDEQFQQNYGELQQRAGTIAVELKVLAGLLNLVGVDGVANTLNESADFFFRVANGSITQEEAGRKALGVTRNLERLLFQIDPDGTKSVDKNGKITTIGRLRNLIDLIKGSFGYKNNVAWVTLGNDWPDGFPVPGGGVVRAGESVPIVEPIQQMLVEIGLMDAISVNGTFDLVTQDAIATFQKLNGITVSGLIDTETIEALNSILNTHGEVYAGESTAMINNYLGSGDSAGTSGATGTGAGGAIGLGTYSADVQSLQIVLYTEGYEITKIDGLYDQALCDQVRKYQIDNELEQSNDSSCIVTTETIDSLNSIIKTKGLLGSGFVVSSNGALTGNGVLSGTFGPGTVDFSTNKADADTLREGDIVLMYLFLDEKTILITRSQTVIDEIIRRRALSDIFNKKTKQKTA